MTNIPKPELERGNYICYADEPNTIVDNAGGGGGDEGGGGGGAVQVLNGHYDFGTEAYVLDSEITFNELKSAFDAGADVRLELVQESEQYTLVEVGRMESLESMESSLEGYPYYKARFAGSSTFELSAESPDSPMTI